VRDLSKFFGIGIVNQVEIFLASWSREIFATCSLSVIKANFLKTNELICSGGASVSPKGLAGVGKGFGYVDALDL